MAFDQTRNAIMEALENPTEWMVFSYPPATPLPHSLILQPDNPYCTPNTISNTSVTLNFTLRLCVNTADNQADIIELENMIAGILLRLPSWVVWSDVSSPATLEVGTAQLTVCDFTLAVAVNID
jgi:hypothetical protein